MSIWGRCLCDWFVAILRGEGGAFLPFFGINFMVLLAITIIITIAPFSLILAYLGFFLAHLDLMVASSWPCLHPSWLVLAFLGFILATSWPISTLSWLHPGPTLAPLGLSCLLLSPVGVILADLGLVSATSRLILTSSWPHPDPILTPLQRLVLAYLGPIMDFSIQANSRTRSRV